MNLVILTEKDRVKDNLYKLSDKRYFHIKSILKKEIGDTIEAGILNESRGTAQLISCDETNVQIQYTENFKTDLSNIKIDIICALPRPQTLKKILPLIATTGVGRLHLINSNRVEKSFFQSPLVNENQKIENYLIEGLSQGKRITLPEVKVYKRFKEYFETGYKLLEDNKSESLKVVLHPEEKNNLLSLYEKNKFSRLIVAIGPEGGWIPKELDLFTELGFIRTELGKSVLRVENAVNAVISQKELLEII